MRCTPLVRAALDFHGTVHFGNHFLNDHRSQAGPPFFCRGSVISVTKPSFTYAAVHSKYNLMV